MPDVASSQSTSTMRTPRTFQIPAKYTHYAQLYEALSPEMQAWVLEQWYWWVLEPQQPPAKLRETMANLNDEEMSRVHKMVLDHVLGDTPIDWRSTLTSLVYHTQTSSFQLDASELPPPPPYGFADTSGQESGEALATDLTCYLHPAALMLSNADLREDKRSIQAIFTGVHIDVIVQILWRMVYDCQQNAVPVDADPRLRFYHPQQQFADQVTAAIQKYRALFDERYWAIDPWALNPFQRDRFLNLYMTSHLGHPVEIERDFQGRVATPMVRLLVLTKGDLRDWIKSDDQPGRGGVMVVACDDGTIKEFPVTVKDMDTVEHGGILFHDRNTWPMWDWCRDPTTGLIRPRYRRTLHDSRFAGLEDRQILAPVERKPELSAANPGFLSALVLALTELLKEQGRSEPTVALHDQQVATPTEEEEDPEIVSAAAAFQALQIAAQMEENQNHLMEPEVPQERPESSDKDARASSPSPASPRDLVCDHYSTGASLDNGVRYDTDGEVQPDA